MNPLFMTDSYNITHWQMRDNVDNDIVYMYNRNKGIILFGLAGLANNLLNMKINHMDVVEAGKFAAKNGIESNDDMWFRLVNEWEGRIGNVLEIQQVPELRWYPKGTPLARIYNKVQGFAEVATYFEGYLTKCYFPSMVLTKLYEYKMAGLKNIHNFGYRSHRSEEDAMWSDLAFLLLYNGTDSFHVNWYTENAATIPLLAPYEHIFKLSRPNTIRAASHKVVQSFYSEEDAYRIMIRKNSGKTIAFIIDTFGAERFIEKYLKKVLNLAYIYSTNIMMRIDSGNYIDQAKIILKAILDFKLNISLDNDFLVPKYGIIVGDNMELRKIIKIRGEVQKWIDKNWNAVHIDIDKYLFFGLGSKLYSDITRDMVGMVSKLGWSYGAGGDTMKTTKGKESLLGENLGLVYSTEENKYTVVNNTQALYNVETVNMDDFMQMISGKAYGYKARLEIAPEIRINMNNFLLKKSEDNDAKTKK